MGIQANEATAHCPVKDDHETMKKCKMVSAFTQPDVNTREVGRTRDKRSVLPTSQVFTSGYVNTETILHFFYKITNERGTKTMFTYARVKWFSVMANHSARTI